MSIQTEITRLNTAKTNILTSIENKGVNTSSVSTLDDVPALIDSIETGGGGSSTPEVGFVVNEWNSDGYPTDVSIVGMTIIPNAYFLYAWNDSIWGGVTNASLSRPWLYNATLHIPTTIKTIGNACFRNCSGLTAKKLGGELPDSIEEIKQDAFRDCSILDLTKLPSNLKKIYSSVFYNCTKLALTNLPTGLTWIGTNAFYNCSAITIKEIPSGVSAIANYVFYKCTSLTELTCNGVITSIGTYAFYGCSQLTSLVLPNVTSVPTLSNKNAFTSTPIASGTGYIYVPDDLVSSFQSASNWSTYSAQIKGISELT